LGMPSDEDMSRAMSRALWTLHECQHGRTTP
jgi:hypothetical protein